MDLIDRDKLQKALELVLCQSGMASTSVKILERNQNAYSATFPSEIITCRINGCRELKLFCKGGGNHPRNIHDQQIIVRQGGIPYEAGVYRHILLPQNLSALAYYGAYKETDTDTVWLFFEYLENSVQAGDVSCQVEALKLAAHWIGNFHRTCEALVTASSLPFLKVYDAAYYLQWPRRTAAFARELKSAYPWLERACQRAEELVDLLVERPATVIHGDFYADNILFRYGTIYPLDWGWAAVAAGENDLATLTERWPIDIVEECHTQYQNARWPKGAPGDFLSTLDAARLYQLFRWLGDRPERTIKKENRWRFEHLYELGVRLGLIV